MKFTDQVALITGGSRGIGKAIAIKLGKEGAQLVIINQNPKTAAAAQEDLKKLGIKTVFYSINVADSTSVERVVKDIVNEYGKIDILVNNAGITRDGLIIRMKVSDWDEVLDVNLKGAFNCIRAVSRSMITQRSGSIISISSVVGILGNVGQANYAAAKAGMIGLMKSVARELASRHITVNTIAPGYISTELTHRLSAETRGKILSRIPLQRFASAEEVAHLVAFLASDEAKYITGQTIGIDGGMLMI